MERTLTFPLPAYAVLPTEAAQTVPEGLAVERRAAATRARTGVAASAAGAGRRLLSAAPRARMRELACRVAMAT